MEAVGGLLEAVSPDEPHGVVRPAVGVLTEPVDRNDSRVLQTSGNPGFLQEPVAAVRVIGVIVEDALECDLAVELDIARDKNGTKPTMSVGSQNVEPLAIRPRCGRGITGGRIELAVCSDFRGSPINQAQGGIDGGIAEHSKRLVSGAVSAHGGQALLGAPAVLLDVQVGERLDYVPLSFFQIAARDKVGSQRARFVANPRLKAGNELNLIYQAILQRQQSEKEIALSTDDGHRRGLLIDRKRR